MTTLNDATPNTAYVEFSDCSGVVVSVEDVRRLGVEPAREICQETSRNLTRGAGVFIGVIFVLSVALAYLIAQFFKLVLPALCLW